MCVFVYVCVCVCVFILALSPFPWMLSTSLPRRAQDVHGNHVLPSISRSSLSVRLFMYVWDIWSFSSLIRMKSKAFLWFPLPLFLYFPPFSSSSLVRLFSFLSVYGLRVEREYRSSIFFLGSTRDTSIRISMGNKTYFQPSKFLSRMLKENRRRSRLRVGY